MPLRSCRTNIRLMVSAAAPAPTIEPISTRVNRSVDDTSVATMNATTPTSHDTSTCPERVERDQPLRHGEGEDEHPAPGREQREVEVAELELGAEEEVADERSERRAADHADDADPAHHEQEVAHAAAEVVGLARAHLRREPRQQRGLHRLEQQDRDARQEQADDEVGDHRPARLSVARSWAPRNGA